MFKNVLIAEDHESVNISVQKTLIDIGVLNPDYAYYCDDALIRIKKRLQMGEPYELLITDLSFEDDGGKQNLIGGTALIAAAKEMQPALRVLVFSAEHKPAIVKGLFNDLGIYGFVRKARRDAQELKLAIEIIYQGKKYFPAEFRQPIRQLNAHEFTAYDIMVIKLLSQGILQKEIPVQLQQQNIKPSGLSSVEKRLGHIREVLEFTKNEQLVAFCKDMGII